MEIGVYYSSDNVSDQSGAEVNITSVVADGYSFERTALKFPEISNVQWLPTMEVRLSRLRRAHL